MAREDSRASEAQERKTMIRGLRNYFKRGKHHLRKGREDALIMIERLQPTWVLA